MYNKRNLLPVFLTYFLDNFGLAVIYPIFTPLLLRLNSPLVSEGTPYLQRTLLLGFLIATFPLAQFFSAPLIGQFSDRWGRRKAFLFTILGTTLCYSFTALSIVIDSLIFLFLSRFMSGLCAGNLTLCLASVADMSHNEAARARNFGQIATVGGLSFLLAIASGGILSDVTLHRYFHPSFPFWLTSLLSLFNLICMFTLFQETRALPPPSRLKLFHGIQNILSAIRAPELRKIYLVNFFFMLAWVDSMQFLPAFLIQIFNFSTSQITLSLMLIGLLWSSANFFINRPLSKRFHPTRTLLFSLLLLGILLLLLAFSNHTLLFFSLLIPATCCAALSWTNGLATVSLRAPAALQGSILGINQSMTSVAAMASPLLGGFLTGLSSHALYLFSALSSLIAFSLLCRSKTTQVP